jgi:hypothetical protein
MPRKQSIGQFAKVMKKHAIVVKRGSVLVTRKIAYLSVKGVVHATPVLTGFARSGWLVSINTARGRVVGIRSAASTIAMGNQVIKAAKGDDTIYIHNSVKYVIYLDEGTSPQADPGFIGKTFAQAAKVVLDELDRKGFINSIKDRRFSGVP